MTIMYDLLAEYPDLALEVRSILLARSQEGATIADIEDDYRKNMGLSFPIYQNITEFLLSIPYVTAFCDEQGKLIFNVKPTPKTKHIYDMVQEQKPQQQQQIYYPKKQQIEYHHQYVEENRYETNPNVQNNVNNTWYCRNQKLDHHYNYEYIQKKNINNNKNNVPVQINVIQANNQHANKIVNKPVINNEDQIVGKAVEESIGNNYYQDNCNHLFNRLYNNQPIVPAQNPNTNLNTNNHQTNLNNRITQYHHTETKLNGQKSQFKTIQQQNYFNIKRQENHLNPFKQPIARTIRPNASGASSPSQTKSSRYNESLYTTDSDYEAHLLDFLLLGDDFFLFMARMELKCKFKKYDRVLQSGLCVSGQTIRGAIRHVRSLEDQEKSIIVNIGSVDIMRGRPLVQIEHDFRELLNLMFKKGYTPILTTLAPLANCAHDKQIKTKLFRFNEFIKKEGRFLIVMDIWSCLVNERGQILFDCFQNEPRMVTGASEPYVFWNKIGRQRVLQLIESQLEY